MSRKSLLANRASLTHKIGYAVRHPARITPYVKRTARDTWLRLKHPDHVAYYRAVMASDAGRNPEAAVGSRSHDRWLALGEMQFDYLAEHGLAPGHRMLDIGCGNLRAGWRFIAHLDTGNYYGIDISPDILISAKQTLTTYELQDKLPHLTLTQDLKLDFLPVRPLRRRPRAQRLLALTDRRHRRVPGPCRPDPGPRRLLRLHLRPHRGRRTPGPARGLLLPDRDPAELARGHGLQARFMEDWEKRPHGQSKIRVNHPE